MIPLNVSKQVQGAIHQARPVIALESSLLCQGLPYPQNVKAVLAVENLIRKMGCEPATIAIKKGEVFIGLTEKNIQYFGERGQNVIKVSKRDLSYVVAQKLDGATTVASTLSLARRAGIQVFATGGIGGVHRDSSVTLDESADLLALSQTPMIVVSAGAKAILDLGKTLERLESLCIPVVGFGTNEFPAFYSRTSGHKLTMRLDKPLEIAKLYNAQVGLGLSQSILVANPISENDEIPKNKIDTYLEIAFKEMNQNQIYGKDITPYLLNRMVELSKGTTLIANTKLIENNAKLACKISLCLMKK